MRMAMPIDLNMDMGQLVSNMMQKKAAGGSVASSVGIGPYKGAIIGVLVVIIGVFAFVSFVCTPQHHYNLKKEGQLAEIKKKEAQLPSISAQIIDLTKKIGVTKKKYLEELTHFENSENVEGLYRTVSSLAKKYDLVISHIKGIAPPAAPLARTDEEKAAAAAAAAAKKVDEVLVAVELKGNFGGFMKFKEDLAIAERLLSVNKESVKVSEKKEELGKIYVSMNLTTYKIDKEPFQNVVETNE